jgi:hypothetical protein
LPARRREVPNYVVPAAGFVLLFSIDTALQYDPITEVLTIPLRLAAPLAALGAFILANLGVGRKQYRRAIYLAFTCAATLGAFGVPFVAAGLTYHSARHLRLYIHEAEYWRAIESVAPDVQGYRYIEFNWGGFMMNPTKLVYDESDELSLPAQQRSTAWWEKMQRSEFAACAYGTKRLKSHFYVAEFSC